MKMATIVGIFIFISRENFMLSLTEREKKFYNLGAWIWRTCPKVIFLMTRLKFIEGTDQTE